MSIPSDGYGSGGVGPFYDEAGPVKCTDERRQKRIIPYVIFCQLKTAPRHALEKGHPPQ